jgi:hypothetical protein
MTRDLRIAIWPVRTLIVALPIGVRSIYHTNTIVTYGGTPGMTLSFIHVKKFG